MGIWARVGLLLAGLVLCPAHGQGLRGKIAGFLEPLQFHDEFVEVTRDGTLRRRYRFKDDWEAELNSYYEEAVSLARQRGTAPIVLKTAWIFFDEARITYPKVIGTDGMPVRAVMTTPQKDIDKVRNEVAEQWAKFVMAFTRGELQVEWEFHTLENVTWKQPGMKVVANYRADPKRLAESIPELYPELVASGVDCWNLVLESADVENHPTVKKVAQGYGGRGVNLAYNKQAFHGGYVCGILAPGTSVVAHEWVHQFFEGNLPRTEGLRVNRVHGLNLVGGFENGDCGYPGFLSNYRNAYYHLYRRDMWRRFRWNEPHELEPEPFQKLSYSWKEVQHDCYWKLPRLSVEQIAVLTGLPSLTVNAPVEESITMFELADQDLPKLGSPYRKERNPGDVDVNNVLDVMTESCAVLRTATGHWIFAQIDLVDVYVEMNRIAGRNAGDTEAFGWFMKPKSGRPLVILRASEKLPVPRREIRYFRSS